jgi:hypothetical protein
MGSFAFEDAAFQRADQPAMGSTKSDHSASNSKSRHRLQLSIA